MRKILYHGSLEIISTPMYGQGKVYNDYGQGFYCTESLELAKEWSCAEREDGSFDFKFDGEALQRSSLAGDFDEIPENPPFFGGHETGKRVAAGTFPPGCGRI